jgi:hypothetical protein
MFTELKNVLATVPKDVQFAPPVSVFGLQPGTASGNLW